MIEHPQKVITIDQPPMSNEKKHTESSGLPKDTFVKCTRCRALLYAREWKRNLKVCEVCGYHFRLTAIERITGLLDAGSFVEANSEMKSGDPLNFSSQSRTYAEKLREE